MPPLPLHTPEPAPRRAHGRLRQARSNNALPFKPDNAGSDELCHLYLIYRCSDPALCGKAHSRVPYLWQRKEGKTWSALPNNEDIERDYCNSAKTTQ
ncbi:zinc finger CCCH-type antiviral protein 1-like [Engraulis encrasicolus]|uniref:zinc finger CCCH-type antiviral protein 1-like n=1 Tax=Engraulis encrasicolus TaxID=184585 RepID=UPI002FD31F11